MDVAKGVVHKKPTPKLSSSQTQHRGSQYPYSYIW